MTEPRLLFMAMPPPGVLAAMWTAVARNGLDTRLGPALFPASNWHQTLSDRQADTPAVREAMLRAGARVAAQTCTVTLNRLRDQRNGALIHWAFRARGEPDGFAALLAAVDSAVAAQGFPAGLGHTPHVTISYGAPDRLGPSKMDVVHWTVDEIQLVVGGGRPYRYEVLGRWPLRPQPPDPAAQQFKLF